MRLIIVDGLDATGKDTQAALIAAYYKSKGQRVTIRSHPSNDNYFGKKAKKALLKNGKINKIKASLFYMIDVLRSIRRYYHPNEKGVLIMVRYLMGTAYLPKRLAPIGYTFFEHLVPTSPYMFFLDAPPAELLKRIKSRDEREIFETPEDLMNVRCKAMALTEHWHIIDTSLSIEETFTSIENILKTLDKNDFIF
jgi:dTMP kinase